MEKRTFVIGDVHGDLDALMNVLGKLPKIQRSDTVVFLGDYIDRGPRSSEVVRVVQSLDNTKGCNVIALRGNHEDAWLRVIDEHGWAGFTFVAENGCLATLRSYTGVKDPKLIYEPQIGQEEGNPLCYGTFFPEEDIAWMRSLPHWYEDDHAIYVHAGLVEDPQKGFLHPKETPNPSALLWTRSRKFFSEYRGKRVVVGHTVTATLPPELSSYTPEDPTDMWAGECVLALDTGCGKGGFLTAVELPAMKVYESR